MKRVLLAVTALGLLFVGVWQTRAEWSSILSSTTNRNGPYDASTEEPMSGPRRATDPSQIWGQEPVAPEDLYGKWKSDYGVIYEFHRNETFSITLAGTYTYEDNMIEMVYKRQSGWLGGHLTWQEKPDVIVEDVGGQRYVWMRVP